MWAKGRIEDLRSDQRSLRDSNYVKDLPKLLDGLVRVYMDHEYKRIWCDEPQVP